MVRDLNIIIVFSQNNSPEVFRAGKDDEIRFSSSMQSGIVSELFQFIFRYSYIKIDSIARNIKQIELTNFDRLNYAKCCTVSMFVGREYFE